MVASGEPSVAGASPRHIIHADMDAFYASVEQHDDPALRGLPVLVGGSPKSRGVVAAASYEARAFGCRSAMPMRTAARLCPQAVIVPPRFPRYRQASEQVMAIFRRVTPLVEPLSLDEAFLDVTHRVQAGTEPAAVARWLRAAVRRETGLTVSCGVAATKSVAKVASDRDKPDGLTVVAPGDERAFLAPLPIRDLWGVGPRTAERLSKAGVKTIGELAERPLPWLIERFGVRGEWFYRLARGEDDRPVSTSREAKSISAEQTFAEDLADPEALAEVVREQAARVARRLRKAQLRSRTVQLKLRLADFTTFTRRRTLPVATDQAGPIQSAALEMLAAETGGGRRFRLVGTGVSNLIEAEEAAQLSLFDPLPTPARAAALRETVDALQDRYGDESVDWGAGRSRDQARGQAPGPV